MVNNKGEIITNKAKELLRLLLEFIRFGLFTYGGGWSIVAQMDQLYVQKKKIITSEELLDLVSVAKSIPGTMIANVAMLFGYRAAGLVGGIICVFGMCLPPMAVLVVISFFYGAFRENYWVNAAMQGMQAAVVPIIASVAVNLLRGSVKYPPCIAIIGFSTLIYLFADIHPVLLVVIGAVAGLLMGEYYERKEQK